jgi:hypothetical protein
MKDRTMSRKLSSAEQTLALSVFGQTLPPWNKIMVSDGLGYDDRPWTHPAIPSGVILSVGPVIFPDCLSQEIFQGRRIDCTFVHEMTHVWQYFHGYHVVLSSVWAQSLGDGYDGALGKSWNAYNVEQQATIVENWYKADMKTDDAAYPYIKKVVRKGGGSQASDTLSVLKGVQPDPPPMSFDNVGEIRGVPQK